ncbi:hypothetical protein P4110_05965 [Pseudomonas aeruginosa]|nr:hypothetical protein [Pseudomonas aeruginosa]
MLNPAIEANQGLLLKENSLKVGALGTQPPPLLYVISSHGDSATHFAFPLGQWVGVNLTGARWTWTGPTTEPAIASGKKTWIPPPSATTACIGPPC